MSYCVHCGVELDPTAGLCPLCQTPVRDPHQEVDRQSPKPFPSRMGEVKPAAQWEAALLITAILLSVSAACGILNIFLRARHIWSLYIIGGAAMLWLWIVPPLLRRKLHILLRLLVDVAAIGLYVLLIAFANKGLDWYMGAALPVILAGAAIALFLGLVLRGRSILSTVTILIGAAGVFCLFMELFLDRYLRGAWEPAWSLVVAAVCLAVIVPLIVVRHVPSLREEARRRFHM